MISCIISWTSALFVVRKEFITAQAINQSRRATHDCQHAWHSSAYRSTAQANSIRFQVFGVHFYVPWLDMQGQPCLHSQLEVQRSACCRHPYDCPHRIHGHQAAKMHQLIAVAHHTTTQATHIQAKPPLSTCQPDLTSYSAPYPWTALP